MSRPLEHLTDQYDIVAKLREGGMGAIYKVRHRLLDELRVIKVLRPQLVGDRALAERLQREARAAIALRHPNVVQIFDFSVDPSGTGFIVMEHIPGADLHQLIVARNLPSLPLALEIARQGLRALGYLHDQGFLHRDVSPDNLMLSQGVDGEPLVKVIDLGIAKRRDAEHQLTESGMFLGKLRYASPEHFASEGSAAIDARSDVYTFGLVLYELITGVYPVPGQGTSQRIAGHLYFPPMDFAESDPQGRVPPKLRGVILRCLAKKPDERFADAGEALAGIAELQRVMPLTAAHRREAERLTQQQAVASPAPASQPTTAAERAEERHRQQVEEAELGILGLLHDGALGEALERLAAARQQLGENETFASLDLLLGERRKERLHGLVRDAGVALEAERYGRASELLREVLGLDPDNAWILRQLRLAEAAHRQATGKP